ncbi:hypothetical protein NKR23_g356 [Pleurostoma richardsiae]|uniref:Uncharacterized protein n=1 Tax=Pleurostoma richardsiae TaxID=41990 RepID=A0AA38S7F7_9PEZI|nr:hypothetical protein NKR23_g356 [Pleurostoma richardsiae]
MESRDASALWCRMAVLVGLPSFIELRDLMAKVHGGAIASCSLTTATSQSKEATRCAVILFMEAEGLKAFTKGPRLAFVCPDGTLCRQPTVYIPKTRTFPFWERPSMQLIAEKGRTRCLIIQDFELSSFPSLWLDLGINKPYSLAKFQDLFFDRHGNFHIHFKDIEQASQTYDRRLQGKQLREKYRLQFEPDPCAKPVSETGQGNTSPEYSVLSMVRVTKENTTLGQVYDYFIVNCITEYKPQWPGQNRAHHSSFRDVVQHVARKYESVSQHTIDFQQLFERMLPFLLVPLQASHAKMGDPAVVVAKYLETIEREEALAGQCWEFSDSDEASSTTEEEEEQQIPPRPAQYPNYDAYWDGPVSGDIESHIMPLKEFCAMTHDEFMRFGTVFHCPRPSAPRNP